MTRQWRLAGDERLGAAVGPPRHWIIPPSSNNTTDKIILSWLKHVLDWRWLSAAFSLIAWPPVLDQFELKHVAKPATGDALRLLPITSAHRTAEKLKQENRAAS
jgi:hypothetical protein